MIKSTEVRIGNLVDCGTVWEIESDCFRVMNHDKTHTVKSKWFEINPIPLTEAWLKRFGFHKWGRDDMPSTISFEKGILQICTNEYFKDGKTFGWMWHKTEENNFKSWEPKVIINSVHALQNLFFALTGEELQLTEV